MPEFNPPEWYRGAARFAPSLTATQCAAVEELIAGGYLYESTWPDLNYYPEEIHLFVLLQKAVADGEENSALVSDDGRVDTFNIDYGPRGEGSGAG